MLNWNRDLVVVVEEAQDVARRLRQPLTTAHLLLCLFTLKNRASDFLSDRQVTADSLLDRIREKPVERDGTWERVFKRATDVATVSSSQTLSSLHVLVALCSFVESAAYQLMSQLRVDMATIRNTALSYLATADEPNPPEAEPPPQLRPAVMPLLPHPVATPPARGGARRAGEEEPPLARGLREPDDVRRSRIRRSQAAAPPAAPVPPTPEENARSLAARLFQRPDEPEAEPPPPPAALPRTARLDGPLPPTVRRTGETHQGEPRTAEPRRGDPPAPPPAPFPQTAPAAAPPPSERPGTTGPREPPASAPAPASRPHAAAPRSHFVLRDSDYPTLVKLGRNLTLLAADGLLDDVYGRDGEIEQVVDILNKRRANNPVLLGDAGVGKTAIVEGLARRIAGVGPEPPPPGLEDRVVISLEASLVVAGTGLRGSFSQRIQQLRKEVASAEGRIVVFLDELHHWIGMGSGDGAADGAGELKTALARGEFPCIGATTFAEYRKFIDTDPAFGRRFTEVRVEQPTPDAAIRILRGVKARYEAHHGIRIEDDAIEAAVRLTHRYLPERQLPDKAIDVLDEAGARARRFQTPVITRPIVARIVGQRAGIAPEKLLMADTERFLNLEEQLMRRIIGHQHAIERVAYVLRRNYAGFVSGRPIGSFLFLGPTGVGKTEFAKALAEILFQDHTAMLRIDMSEFSEPHTVARLIGAPPGYVGHDSGGQLTEAVRRRPYQLVLLDEIEKADTGVLDILIQLLDEGRLTDSRGRTVDFSNTVVLMTSNLGADATAPPPRRVGFNAAAEPAPAADALHDRVRNAARPHFRPELWNRIDEILVFSPLSRDEISRIARLMLTRSSERLLQEKRIAFSFAPEVVDLLVDSGGWDPLLGARPMRRTIERLVELPIADMILRGEVAPPATLDVVVRDGRIAVDASVAGDEPPSMPPRVDGPAPADGGDAELETTTVTLPAPPDEPAAEAP